eukprot:3923294-Alexandrium_andersonii.AAC.1
MQFWELRTPRCAPLLVHLWRRPSAGGRLHTLRLPGGEVCSDSIYSGAHHPERASGRASRGGLGPRGPGAWGA